MLRKVHDRIFDAAHPTLLIAVVVALAVADGWVIGQMLGVQQ